jgi:uncharacterized protein YqeY
MSTLKEKINADYMSAFRNKNMVAKNLLSVIKGEIQLIEKNDMIENMSDEGVTKILNKFVKSLKETNENFPSAQIAEELFIVESYLPKQMLESEIKEKIESLIADGASNVAEIMRAFATLPADRKIVAQIYQSLK